MIYISLTTIPERMNFEESARKNLNSLINQDTDKEYKVLYNVPLFYKEKNEECEVPQWIYDLANENPRLIINKIDDLGPVTKVVGALEYTKNPEDILIICDDDHQYHKDMLEYHIKKRALYPRTAIAFRGDRMLEKREWLENGIKKWVFLSSSDYFPVKQDLNITIPGHWHSVSYERGMFKDDFLDRTFLQTHWADDLILAYYIAKNNFEIKCVNWDQENDFRLVNYYGRPCNSFPVEVTLPFEYRSGCYVFRNRTGQHLTDQSTYPQHWIDFVIDYYAQHTIHTEND